MNGEIMPTIAYSTSPVCGYWEYRKRLSRQSWCFSCEQISFGTSRRAAEGAVDLSIVRLQPWRRSKHTFTLKAIGHTNQAVFIKSGKKSLRNRRQHLWRQSFPAPNAGFFNLQEWIIRIRRNRMLNLARPCPDRLMVLTYASTRLSYLQVA